MIFHTQDVRATRTSVNVESVLAFADKAYVSERQETGAILRRIWRRSGLSMLALGRACGYSAASGVQRYLEEGYSARLSIELAEKLAAAMVGLGDPPVTREEILSLTGLIPPSNALPFRMEGASVERMREDLPIYGTALGASRVEGGEAVEQTTLNTGDIVSYVKRPVILNGNAKAYGLYVQGSSMYPVHPEGSLILAEEKKPPRVGDDVVVYLRANGDDDDGRRSRAVLVKRLVRRTAEYVELEQFTPAVTFRIEREKVLRIDRVLTLTDLLG